MAINQSEIFNHVPNESIPVNTYDLSFDNVCTTEAGRLIVTFCRRVLPGEKWSVWLDSFARTLPLQSPIYGKLDLYHHAFFVRTGSLSTRWENYIRAGEDGTKDMLPDILRVQRNLGFDNTRPINDFELCQLIQNFSRYDFYNDENDKVTHDADYRPFLTHGSLSDYLGIGSFPEEKVNYEKGFVDGTVLMPFDWRLEPFKAYQAIWSDYYADANVMTFDNLDTIQYDWLKPITQVFVRPGSYGYEVDDGHTRELDEMDVVHNLFKTRRRCYAKDYFTSALPEPQRGPDVLIPVDAQISILNNLNADPSPIQYNDTAGNSKSRQLIGTGDDENIDSDVLALGALFDNDNGFSPGVSLGNLWNAHSLKAEISSLTSTITDLRTAIALQEMYEARARYGSRYKEFIYGYFGSMIPDDQLVRPWYLGGIKQPIQIAEVVQTAPDSDGTGVGTLYGKAITSGDGQLFERTFADYGILMVITSIRPRNYYTNSVKKEFTIIDHLDEFNRKLQAIGEQDVKNWEVTGFFQNSRDSYDFNDTFGYQMRFSEYKYNNDEIHGDFKGSLSDWTIARDFSNGVVLNSDFLEVHPGDINHIFQYTGDDIDHFLLNLHFTVHRETPMEIYSVPRIN